MHDTRVQVGDSGRQANAVAAAATEDSGTSDRDDCSASDEIDREDDGESDENVVAHTTAACRKEVGCDFLNIVPVRVRARGVKQSTTTWAMLDTASNVHLASRKLFDAMANGNGVRQHILQIRGVTGGRVLDVPQVDLDVAGIKRKAMHPLNDVSVVPAEDFVHACVPSIGDRKKWPQLELVPFDDVLIPEVTLLIGMKALNLFGFGAQANGPTLVETPLGYSIIGAEESKNAQANVTIGQVYHVIRSSDRELDVKFGSSHEVKDVSSLHHPSKSVSEENRSAGNIDDQNNMCVPSLKARRDRKRDVNTTPFSTQRRYESEANKSARARPLISTGGFQSDPPICRRKVDYSSVVKDHNSGISHECQPATVHVCQIHMVSQPSPEKNLKVTCKSRASCSSLQMRRISSDDAIPAKRAVIRTVERNPYPIKPQEGTGSIPGSSPLEKFKPIIKAAQSRSSNSRRCVVQPPFLVASSSRWSRPSRSRHRSRFKQENAEELHRARTFIKTFSRGQSRSWFCSKVKSEDGVFEGKTGREKSSIARYFDFIFK